MNQLQTRLLELLIRFDQICQSNEIAYSLHGGTLLGAIREQGFIPWDDDIDVTMTRENWLSFLYYVEKNQSRYSVIRTGTIFRFICDSEAWIDIFVYDYISQKRIVQAWKCVLLDALAAMLRNTDDLCLSRVEKQGRIRLVFLRVGQIFGRLFSNERKLRWYDYVSKSFCGDKTLIHRSNDQRIGRCIAIPDQWMETYTHILFEGHAFMVTSHYHDVLMSSYGENYMVPIRDKGNEIMHANTRTLFQKRH